MMTFAFSFNTASHRSSENGRLPIQLRRSLEGEESAQNLSFTPKTEDRVMKLCALNLATKVTLLDSTDALLTRIPAQEHDI